MADPDTNERSRRANPLFRYIGRRLSCLALVAVIIVSSIGACAIFAPTFFESTIRFAQSAALRTYTLILSVTGNPALRVSVYDVTVSSKVSISRDMGMFSILYGEGAEIEGTMRVSLGADLKQNLYGVLSCDVDDQTVRTTENRAIFSSIAFDSQQIKQQAYVAFKHEAANVAIASYWPEARSRLKSQFATWALGVTIPDQATLTECPANLSDQPTPVP